MYSSTGAFFLFASFIVLTSALPDGQSAHVSKTVIKYIIVFLRSNEGLRSKVG